MKLEQNSASYSGTGSKNGYIDLARSMSALNGKSITQTKRSKGKYKPLGFLVRVRAIVGTVVVESLNCGYPTRNSVVLAGHARDEMLKSAGVSRSNLETYQKELRLKFEAAMTGATQYYPGATDRGTGSGGWGESLTYDYTNIVIEDPDGSGGPITKPLIMLGTQSTNSDDWDSDSGFYVVDNWKNWRHSLTPAAAADDIQQNVFSWAIQQSTTADDIIDMIDDSQDEKPYDLADFTANTMYQTVGTSVGNPTTAVFCAPLGLLHVTHAADAMWEIEIVGITEL